MKNDIKIATLASRTYATSLGVGSNIRVEVHDTWTIDQRDVHDCWVFEFEPVDGDILEQIEARLTQ